MSMELIQRAQRQLQAGSVYCTGAQCRAGGVLNFARIGIYQDHPNYGLPHVTGWFGPREDQRARNCFFCGAVVLR